MLLGKFEWEDWMKEIERSAFEADNSRMVEIMVKDMKAKGSS